jgi:predicted deacylase
LTKDVIQIGTAKAAPGEKANGVLNVVNRPEGSSISIPVMIVNGIEGGPVLGIDGCTHGDEYEGPEAIQALIAQLDPLNMRGTVIGVPVVNILAFQAMQRCTPNDTLSYPDLNRNYPGRLNGGLTERIAYTHFHQVVCRTEIFITIHSGGSFAMLPPKVIYHHNHDALGQKSLTIAKAFGWEILWRGGDYPGTLHKAAAQKGIVCIAPEFGGTDRLPQKRSERVHSLVLGIKNVMKHLNMTDGELNTSRKFTFVEGESHISANHGGILYYDPNFELGLPVISGQTLARITDIFGREIEVITAPYDGLAIFLRTIPLVNPGDWVAGIGKYVKSTESL